MAAEWHVGGVVLRGEGRTVCARCSAKACQKACEVVWPWERREMRSAMLVGDSMVVARQGMQWGNVQNEVAVPVTEQLREDVLEILARRFAEDNRRMADIVMQRTK